MAVQREIESLRSSLSAAVEHEADTVRRGTDLVDDLSWRLGELQRNHADTMRTLEVVKWERDSLLANEATHATTLRELELARQDTRRIDWLGAILNPWRDVVLATDHEDGVWVAEITPGTYRGARALDDKDNPLADIRVALDAAMLASPSPDTAAGGE